MIHSGGTFDFDKKSKRLNEVLSSLNDPGIWDDRELSQSLNQERSRLEKILNRIESIGSSLEDAEILLELASNQENESPKIITAMSNTRSFCSLEARSDQKVCICLYIIIDDQCAGE